MNRSIILFIIFTCTYVSNVMFSSFALAEKTIRVGTFDNPPIVSKNAHGEHEGIAIDILEDIAQKNEWKIEYEYDSWANVYKKLEHGEIDLLVGIAYSTQRAEIFDFTQETILSNWGKVYVSTRSTIGQLLDLEGKRIAMMRKSIHSTAFSELLNQFNIQFTPIFVDDYHATLDLVDKGNADAAVVNRIFSALHADKFRNTIETSILFNPVEVRYASPKPYKNQYLQTIDQYLNTTKIDQTSVYHNSIKKWLDINRPDQEIPSWLIWTILAIVTALISTFIFVILLRRQVANRTRALADSEQKYHSLFNDAPDMIHIVDPHGTIVNCNRAEYETLGYTSSEILGKPLLDIITPEHQETTLNAFKEAINGKKIKSYETYMQSKDGRSIPVEVSASPQKSDSKVIAIRAIARDISERKKAEAERTFLENKLRQAYKMESIGQLTAGIAHDFNNILNSVLGYTELSKRVIHTHDQEKLEKYLNEILTAGERAKDLINNMLTFSRKTSKAKEATNIKPIINEVVNLLTGTIPSTIVINITADSNIPPVNCDALQIHQALLNLIINASHAITGHGEITIGLEIINNINSACNSCHENFHGQFVRLFVKDNGTGINPEIMPRLFDPFFSTKSADKGTGMGLSVVHGIAHDSDGHITIDSQHGSGTCVSLYFPPSNDTVKISEETHIETKAGRGQNILIVDDENALTILWEELLSINGYNTKTFNDSRKALAEFQENTSKYNAVLSDYTMPYFNGIELAEKMLTLRPDLNFILCTGYGDKLESSTIEKLGITKILQKPISNKELLDELHLILKR